MAAALEGRDVLLLIVDASSKSIRIGRFVVAEASGFRGRDRF